ncbi:hypothetical protein Nmel_016186, partial [Mimus melanotis]
SIHFHSVSVTVTVHVSPGARTQTLELPHPASVSGHEQFPGLRGSLRKQVMHWTRDDAFVATGIRAARGKKGPNTHRKSC